MKLAFWTGGDMTRIDALLRQSGLMRPKWDERHGADNYGNTTIRKAVGKCGSFYQPHAPGEGKRGASSPAVNSSVVKPKVFTDTYTRGAQTAA